MQWLIDFILSLFGYPKPVKHFEVHMTTDVKLSWTDPTGKLTGVEISMQVAGAPTFTVVNTILPGVQTLSIPSLDDGVYNFQAITINGSKRGKNPQICSIDLESVPGDVTGFAAAAI